MLSRKKFIEKHKDWFWYTPKDKLHLISEELLMDYSEEVVFLGDFPTQKEIMKFLTRIALDV